MASLTDAMYAYFNGSSTTLPGGTAANPINTRAPVSAGVDKSASVGTSSSVLMAANTARNKFFIKNDAAADIWINFGATAAIGPGSGNVKIALGGGYFEFSGYTGIVSAISGTAAQLITAREF